MSKLSTIFKKFPRTFWIANSMELFERWAWYGMFTVLALYLTQSADTGALGFSQSQKGNIMGTVTAILYFLPLFTGALADRFGYKKMLIIAFVILSLSYYFMGQFRSFFAVYVTFLLVALGAAIFKPIVSATVTKTTDEKTSSIGFGIFYDCQHRGFCRAGIFFKTEACLRLEYCFYYGCLGYSCKHNSCSLLL